MCKKYVVASCLLLVLLFTTVPVAGKTVTTKWEADTGTIYDTGFMHMLRKYPGKGVGLFNMDLIENDSPGAGASEKGVHQDAVWGKNRARKTLYLGDRRAEKAFLVIFSYRQGKSPLQFRINNHHSKMDNWDASAYHFGYRWTEFPAEWLEKGENIIELFCPKAKSEEEGWNLYLARADEFEHGGGDPRDVGETSFKSFDGGKSWKQSPFGPDGKTRAEYSVRLSLDRYVKTGWLKSPMIDLWKANSEDFIVPVRVLGKVRITIKSEVPPETSVKYYLRKSTHPGPFSEFWSPYELIGAGESVDIELDDKVMNGRFIQFKAVLSTTNPLKTPIVKHASVTAELFQGAPSHKSITVSRAVNPVIRYPSINWQWELWDRTEFEELRNRENLDDVIAGSKTQFDAIVKLLGYATTRASRKDAHPRPEYPGWDALSILNRLDRHGTLGFCLQFNNFLNGLCMAYGWQGRLVNVTNHEVAEVWSDDFARWVYLDANYENHYLFSIRTGEPMSVLDLHNVYLDYYFPDRPIDWMDDIVHCDHAAEVIKKRADKPPVKRSSTTYHQNEMLAYNGFVHSAFMRMLPRNNFYEKPYPIPLTHGCSSWPWNGYINWYDVRTPPKRQYSWFTDRPRDMWPALNLVHVDATSAYSNKFLYLRFETYTPNFSHFELDEQDSGWKKIQGDRWTWVLASGKNTLRVRAVNKLGARGKPSSFEINRNDVPLEEIY